jgi:V8-like Glu-specific endopeptidase
MSHRRYAPPFLFAFATACALNTACSKSDAPHASNLPSFSDVSDAPAAIQNAARAVVRIATVGSRATGSFVSSDGLLLTNNHVLGVDVCPIEGCTIVITQMHQRGAPVPDPQTVFAVPVAVDTGLDMALVQLWDQAGGSHLGTPNYLSLESRDAASLMGTHVNIVGHPEGHLKKWTSGTVVDSFGSWFETSAFILPGSSGSPVLADDGKLVGIIHRAPVGEDLVTSNGYDVDSIGTASAPLVAAMKAPLPPTMVSAAAPATQDDVLSHDRLYANGRVTTVPVNGQPVPILSMLATACDAALARTSFRSPEDLSTALAPCYDAMTWIECRSDASPVAYAVTCPMGDDVTAWTKRFNAINQRWNALNGEVDLAAVSFGVASLQPSNGQGLAAGAMSLSDALASANVQIDFNVANYVAAFGGRSYAGHDLGDYVRAYAHVPHYELFGTSIASAALWLLQLGSMSAIDVKSILEQLAGDPNVTTSAKLYVEEVRYRSSLLK